MPFYYMYKYPVTHNPISSITNVVTTKMILIKKTMILLVSTVFCNGLFVITLYMRNPIGARNDMNIIISAGILEVGFRSKNAK